MSRARSGAPSPLAPNDPRRGLRISKGQTELMVKKIAIARRAKPVEAIAVNVRRGKKLLTCIQEKLDERPPNSYLTHREMAAAAYVEEMLAGSFAHHKEVLDREEGKIPSRMAEGDGIPLKAFINMPTEGDDAP